MYTDEALYKSHKLDLFTNIFNLLLLPMREKEIAIYNYENKTNEMK